ncbi:hypothetical protein HDU67_009504, partial [Dinochytrium kinnereticum]
MRLRSGVLAAVALWAITPIVSAAPLLRREAFDPFNAVNVAIRSSDSTAALLANDLLAQPLDSDEADVDEIIPAAVDADAAVAEDLVDVDTLTESDLAESVGADHAVDVDEVAAVDQIDSDALVPDNLLQSDDLASDSLLQARDVAPASNPSRLVRRAPAKARPSAKKAFGAARAAVRLKRGGQARAKKTQARAKAKSNFRKAGNAVRAANKMKRAAKVRGNARAATKRLKNVVRAAGGFKKAAKRAKVKANAKAATKRLGNAVRAAGAFNKAAKRAKVKANAKAATKRLGNAIRGAAQFNKAAKRAQTKARFKGAVKRIQRGLGNANDRLKGAGLRAKFRGAQKKVANVNLLRKKGRSHKVARIADTVSKITGHAGGISMAIPGGVIPGAALLGTSAASAVTGSVARKLHRNKVRKEIERLHKIGGTTPPPRAPWHKRILTSQRIAKGVGHASNAM